MLKYLLGAVAVLVTIRIAQVAIGIADSLLTYNAVYGDPEE